MLCLHVVLQQTRPPLHRVCLGQLDIGLRLLSVSLRTSVDRIGPQRGRYTPEGIPLTFGRESGATHLLVNPLVMRRAKRPCEICMAFSEYDVMLLNAQHTWSFR
jgi:hypothetical protein